MLHTKFRKNRPAGSGEEDFWRVFTIYGRGGHLGHVTQMLRTKYRSPYSRRLHIKFGFDPPSGFGEEDVWNCLRRTTPMDDADGRTPDHEYPISSPMSLWLRWAKKPNKYFKSPRELFTCRQLQCWPSIFCLRVLEGTLRKWTYFNNQP